MVLVLKTTLEGKKGSLPLHSALAEFSSTQYSALLALSGSASASVYLAHLLPAVWLLGGSLGVA